MKYRHDVTPPRCTTCGEAVPPTNPPALCTCLRKVARETAAEVYGQENQIVVYGDAPVTRNTAGTWVQAWVRVEVERA